MPTVLCVDIVGLQALIVDTFDNEITAGTHQQLSKMWNGLVYDQRY